MSPTFAMHYSPDCLPAHSVYSGTGRQVGWWVQPNVPHHPFVQYGVPVVAAYRRRWNPQPDTVSMESVARFGSPFQVADSVVPTVAIKMVDLPAGRGRSKKGPTHEPVYPLEGDTAMLTKENLEVAISPNKSSLTRALASGGVGRPADSSGIRHFVEVETWDPSPFHGLTIAREVT